MSKVNTYCELKEKHQKEFNNFPMFYAFSNERFEEGMRKFGLNPETDNDKILHLSGTGGYFKKADEPMFDEMMARHKREIEEAIENDATGNGFIYEMFNYELANHEYGYTGDIEQTLEALDMTMEQINANKKLLRGLRKAKKMQNK